MSFANNLASGPWWDLFGVCYYSPNVTFTNLFGKSVNLGLLPLCPLPRKGHPVVGPCVQSISYSTILPLPSEKGTVTEQLSSRRMTRSHIKARWIPSHSDRREG